MELLAVSDMHGRLDNVLRALDVTRARLVLSCGDWGDPGEIDPLDLRRIADRATVLSIYGNHDDIDLLTGVNNLDGTPILLRNGEIREVFGFRFAGINGIWAKSHRKPWYVTDEDVGIFARTLSGHGVDALLTHGCPVGLADIVPGGRHGGQRCFLDALHTIMPRIHLCGHLHAAQSRALKDGRLVVNVGHTHDGDYWTLDIHGAQITPAHHRLQG